MGVVYLADDENLPRQVAIKLLSDSYFSGEKARQRFHREADVLARLAHPTFVQIFRRDKVGNSPYFVMEYLPKGSLDRRWNGQPRPSREVAQIVAVLAEAMQVAHQAGILHRDLKPANILLGADDRPKIADLGLAKSHGDGHALTGADQRLGTPHYMAPEQIEGREADARTDVYGLGGLLYAGLTGHAPFRGSSMAELYDRVRRDPPRPPRELVADIDVLLERICLKCLAKRPDDRYQSAMELAEDLKRYLAGDNFVVVLPRRRWSRRRWIGTGAAAAGAVSLGVWGVRALRDRQDQAPELRPFGPFDSFQGQASIHISFDDPKNISPNWTFVAPHRVGAKDGDGNPAPGEPSLAGIWHGKFRLKNRGRIESNWSYKKGIAIRFYWKWHYGDAPYGETLTVSLRNDKPVSDEWPYYATAGAVVRFMPERRRVNVAFVNSDAGDERNEVSMPRGVWHHVCITDNGRNIRVFFGNRSDPILDTIVPGAIPQNAHLAIFNREPVANNLFESWIDNLRVRVD